MTVLIQPPFTSGDEVNSSNRSQVKKWLRECGVSSNVTERLTIKQLRQAVDEPETTVAELINGAEPKKQPKPQSKRAENANLRSEDSPVYHPSKAKQQEGTADAGLSDDEILERARQIMRSREEQRKTAKSFTSPETAKSYLTDFFMGQHHEGFAVVYLSTQHHVIEIEELFTGTINAAPVYPREILKRVLQLNAGAVMLAHNHPSGNTDPSRADERVTQRIKDALTHIDVNVLDHIVVGNVPGEAVSFAERGLI